MKRSLAPLACALLIGAAPLAHAAGVNLSWDACGSEGVGHKGFACDTNTGAAFNVYCSVVAPEGTTSITGAWVVVDLLACSALPDWWQFKNAGTCRQFALSASIDFTTLSSAVCQDFWGGLAQGGLSAYSTWTQDSRYGHGRILGVVAIAPALARPMEAGVEYAIMRIANTRTKSTGTSACSGCTPPVRLLLEEIELTQPVGMGDFSVFLPETRYMVGWQTTTDALAFMCGDPVRNTTWGAVKALYR